MDSSGVLKNRVAMVLYSPSLQNNYESKITIVQQGTRTCTYIEQMLQMMQSDLFTTTVSL